VSEKHTLKEKLSHLYDDEIASEIAVMSAEIELLAHRAGEKFGAKDFYVNILRELLFTAAVQPLIAAYEFKGRVNLRPLIRKALRAKEI